MKTIHGELMQLQSQLETNLQKVKETSMRNSKSASKSRSCEEVHEYLERLVENNPNKRKKGMFLLIPRGRSRSDDLYRENGKIHHEECKCRPFGEKAFYARIKKIQKSEKKF